MSSEIKKDYSSLDFLVLQEAREKDAQYFKARFPYHYYTHEAIGKDGFSYGYLLLSKRRTRKIWHEAFHFPGGSKRAIQFSLWKWRESHCLGIANLHLSWQGSHIRVQEVGWILKEMKTLKRHCPRWLFLGDFNADEKSREMKLLFGKGFQNLFTGNPYPPTVGPFNPIRSIYGNIKNQTIDWALGINLEGAAEILFDKPTKGGLWISDHAGVFVQIRLPSK